MNEDKYESIKADDKDHFDQNQEYYDFLDCLLYTSDAADES